MSLQRIHFQTYNRPVLDMLRTMGPDDDGEQCDLSPSYQRESVWTTEQRVSLIKSLLQGLPIGALFLNRRGRDDFVQHIVDGKQRLETLIMWRNDEFAVPRDWFDADWLGDDGEFLNAYMVSWSGLSRSGQRHCANNWLVATYETELPTEAQEAELYDRINYGGTPHEPLEATA